MPIDFQCPYCELRTNVAEQYAGQSGPCAGCGRTVAIPQVPSHAHNTNRHPKTQPPPLGIQCPACAYVGQVLVAHRGYPLWLFPLGLLMACSGVGLIPVVLIAIFLGNRTYRRCPNCESQQLAAWAGQPSPQNEAIWLEAKNADEKAFRNSKLIVLTIIIALLAANVAFTIRLLRYYV